MTWRHEDRVAPMQLCRLLGKKTHAQAFPGSSCMSFHRARPAPKSATAACQPCKYACRTWPCSSNMTRGRMRAV